MYKRIDYFVQNWNKIKNFIFSYYKFLILNLLNNLFKYYTTFFSHIFKLYNRIYWYWNMIWKYLDRYEPIILMLASRKENNSITYSTGIICSTVFEIRLLDFTRTPGSRNLRIRGIYILIDRTVASISVFVIEHICMHVPIHVQPLLQREPAVSTDARYESEKEQGLGGGGGGNKGGECARKG